MQKSGDIQKNANPEKIPEKTQKFSGLKTLWKNTIGTTNYSPKNHPETGWQRAGVTEYFR